MLHIRLVFWYILWCVRIGARPWRYFQLNAPWFNNQKRLFSKLDMDALIPAKWRLAQEPLRPDSQPSSWPVFLKPEWGQNARGILVAEDQQAFERVQHKLLSSRTPYLFQEAATGEREFEVFYIRNSGSGKAPAVLSTTETLNSGGQRWPVNGIFNRHTSHQALPQLDVSDNGLWKYMNELPAFRIARIGLRADSIEAMLAGEFQIIEINVFLPMPLYLLDETVPRCDHKKFIRTNMYRLALITKSVPLKQTRKNIFWPMLFLGYKIR